MINKRVKDLLAEIEKTKKEAMKQWMGTKNDVAARYMGETWAFDFVINRLKSILAAIDDE